MSTLVSTIPWVDETALVDAIPSGYAQAQLYFGRVESWDRTQSTSTTCYSYLHPQA